MSKYHLSILQLDSNDPGKKYKTAMTSKSTSTLVRVFKVSIVDNKAKGAEGHNENWWRRNKLGNRSRGYLISFQNCGICG